MRWLLSLISFSRLSTSLCTRSFADANDGSFGLGVEFEAASGIEVELLGDGDEITSSGGGLAILTFSQSRLLSSFCPSLKTGLGFGVLSVVVDVVVVVPESDPKIAASNGSTVTVVCGVREEASRLEMICNDLELLTRLVMLAIGMGKYFCAISGTLAWDRGSIMSGPTRSPRLRQKCRV